MGDDGEGAENIRVAVRCRPLSSKEKNQGDKNVFERIKNGDTAQALIHCQLRDKSESTAKFGFDYVYGPDSKQDAVYNDLGAPILDKALGGFNGTIFAYGQTGSGKTHTMTGYQGDEGIIPRLNRDLFRRIGIEKSKDTNKRFLVTCSYFEIYNEIICDLLDPTKKKRDHSHHGLDIKEHPVLGIYIKGLQEIVVDSHVKLAELMEAGNQLRTSSATKMNETSSRSHSVFTIKVHQKDANADNKGIFAKINLVDLAGSERVSKTGATGDQLKEGANINKSLSALGNVINALAEKSKSKKKSFIPYRNSKLTRVLQESLGGNSLTSMIAAFSPALSNIDETISTLKYADRAKAIVVNAVKNEDVSQVDKLQTEIEMLKKKLEEQQKNQATGGLDAEEKRKLEEKYKSQIEEIDSMMKQTWEDKENMSKEFEEERLRILAETKKEKEELSRRVEEEKRKRREMMATKKDIELSIRDIGLGDKRKLDQWLRMFALMKQMGTDLQSQRAALHLYRTSLEADVPSWISRDDDDDDDAMRKAHIDQGRVKLKSLIGEIENMSTKEDKLRTVVNDLEGAVAAEIVRVSDSVASRADGESSGDEESHKEKAEHIQRKVDGLEFTMKLISEWKDENLKPIDHASAVTADGVVSLLQSELALEESSDAQDAAVVKNISEVLHKLAKYKDNKDHASKMMKYEQKGLDLVSSRMAARRLVAHALASENQSTLKDIQEECERLRNELEKARDGEKRATSQLSGLEDTSHALSHEVGVIKRQLEEEQIRYKEAEEYKQKYRAELNEAKLEHDRIVREQAESQERESQLSRSVEDLKLRLAQMNEMQAVLSEKVEATERSGEEEITELRREKQTLQMQTDGYRMELESEQRRREESEEARQVLKKTLASTEDELSRARIENAELQERVTALSQESKDGNARLEEKEKRVLDVERELRELASAHETAKESVVELNSQIEKLKSANTTLESRASETQALLNNTVTLEQQLMDTSAELMRAKGDMTRMEDHIKALEQEATESAEFLDEMRSRLDTVIREKEVLEERQYELQEQVDVVTDERDNARQKEEELFEEVVDKEEEIVNLSNRYTEFTDQLNDYRDMLSDAQDEVEQLKEWKYEHMRSTPATPVETPGDEMMENDIKNLSSALRKLYRVAVSNGKALAEDMPAQDIANIVVKDVQLAMSRKNEEMESLKQQNEDLSYQIDQLQDDFNGN